MCKEAVFLEKIMFVYLPEYFPTKKVRDFALKNPKVYNIEHLTELALARYGNYEFVDGDGYDFTDFSDSKTGTIAVYDNCCAIGSVENKIGAIRLCVYNPYHNDVDFFFLPAHAVNRIKEPAHGKTKHKERMRSSYNVGLNRYSKYEPYRLKTFVELATAMDDYVPNVKTTNSAFELLFA